MKTRIEKTPIKGAYCVYKGQTLVATMSHEKPTKSNGRPDVWGVHWLTGRTEWFSRRFDARDCALKA